MDLNTPPTGFVTQLLEPVAWPWPVDHVALVETHISWVFLAGEYACKFKKPVDLGFLDFHERARRLHFCHEELRLNRRLAPDLYLDLIGAQPTPAGWRVGPLTDGAEPAVRMRRFPDDARLDRQLAAGQLDGPALETFATTLAGFQRTLPPARPGAGGDSDHGSAQAVLRPALKNFAALRPAALDQATTSALADLEAWTREHAARLAARFDQRLATGFVREGHGDLHLANLVMLDGRIAAFDGIEFDPALRFIDVQSEVAFLLADLASRGRADLGWRCYNAWLAALGDYDGLDLLGWYLVYRHLVRAKVDSIRLAQAGPAATNAERLRARLTRHIALASAQTQPPRPLLVLMHGLSGSGKSRLAARLAPLLPAVLVRSDLERKRLHGLDPLAPSPAAPGTGLYGAEASARTYARLAAIAQTALGAGISLIVDAAFLATDQREQFIALALACGSRPLVLACTAPPSLLRERVAARRNDPSDADLAVLDAQLAQTIAIGAREAAYRITVDTSTDPDLPALVARLRER